MLKSVLNSVWVSGVFAFSSLFVYLTVVNGFTGALVSAAFFVWFSAVLAGKVGKLFGDTDPVMENHVVEEFLGLK